MIFSNLLFMKEPSDAQKLTKMRGVGRGVTRFRSKRLYLGVILLITFSICLIFSFLKQKRPEKYAKVATKTFPPQQPISIPKQEFRTGVEVAKLAESLERRTAKMQNERRWPKKSLQKMDRLLTEYETLHADIVAGKIEGGKFIRWTCSWWCFGWGDRIRGIITVVTLAILHRRAFVIELDQVGVKLNEFYDDSNVRWTHNPSIETNLHVECNTPKTNCTYLNDKIANGTSFDLISVHTNLDCSGYFASLLPGWKDEDGGGIEEVLNWRGILVDRVFPITPKLRSLMLYTIPQGFDVGIHVRSGLINNNDYVRFGDSPNALAKDYTDCLVKVHPSIATVYIAADNATFQAEVTKSISSWTNVVDSEWVGELGHVAQDQAGGSNMVWRMMVDYEILRRAKVLLVAPSSFSLFAFKSRVYADSKAFAPLKGKLTEKCEAIFVNNTSKRYWVMNPS